MDYVVDQIVSKLIEVVKKKNKAGVTVKPFQVLCHSNTFFMEYLYCSKLRNHNKCVKKLSYSNILTLDTEVSTCVCFFSGEESRLGFYQLFD